jgi:putative tricarboxylic transport membrane protein
MSPNARSRLPDGLFAGGALVVGVIVLRETSGLPPAAFDPLGPAAAPRFIAWALIGLACAMLVQLAFGMRLDSRGQSLILGIGEGEGSHARRPFVAVALLALSVGYAAALAYLPVRFGIVTAVYLAAAGALLAGRNRRRLLLVLGVAAVAGGALDLLFRGLFRLDLP